MSDESFWGLTLVELNALCARQRQIEKRADGRVARVCWVIAQVNGAKDAEIEDFMAKTDAELSEERQARLLAWVDKQVMLAQAQQRAQES